MFSFFRRTFRLWARNSTKPSCATKKPTRRLQCETLEDRVVPSLVTGRMLINTTLSGVQGQVATATSSNGSSVVVWTQAKKGADRDIKAQRLDSSGHKVGGEILVASGWSPQHSATVAMDARGNFAIAWTHDFSSTDRDIRAARYSASGRRMGNDILVARSPKHEYDPSIAMGASGQFVVSYTYQFNSTDSDVKAALFRADGTVKSRLSVADSTRKEGRSSAAMNADGRFAVTLVKSDDIVVKRFTRDGYTRDMKTVAGGGNQQREPHAVMDSRGNTFVAWQENVRNDWNVYLRAIQSSGQLNRISTVQATSAWETAPSVAVDSLSGRTVVAYQSQTSQGTSVKVTELSTAGFRIRTSTMGTGFSGPAVSLGGSAHRFLVAARSLAARGADPDGGIFAQLGVL